MHALVTLGLPFLIGTATDQADALDARASLLAPKPSRSQPLILHFAQNDLTLDLRSVHDSIFLCLSTFHVRAVGSLLLRHQAGSVERYTDLGGHLLQGIACFVGLRNVILLPVPFGSDLRFV